MNKNEESSIGKRIGRLLQQYELRIKYAEYRAELYEQERLKASSLNQTQKEAYAKVAKSVWEIYSANLASKKSELVGVIQKALIGYSDRERRVWWLYFIESKSSYEIEDELHINARSVSRAVVNMKRDMELRFDIASPQLAELRNPHWSATDLANYLTKNPSGEYVSAVRDMLDYGAVNLDALEFDENFQEYLSSIYGGDGDGE